MHNSLLISEDFYSVQCEGISTGFPAYFVRLAICNLNCGMSMEKVNEFRKGSNTAEAGTIKPDLPGASWVCDTIPVWTRGVEQPFNYLIDRWKEQGIYQDILDGTIHIIWTGGEPTLPVHQQAIYNFYKYWYDLERENASACFPFMEIETNGTCYLDHATFQMMHQINCSPKLSNSGLSEKKRIIPEAIKRIMEHSNYQFKFVISDETDIKEMFDTYINPFHIPLNHVVCMPGLDSQENFHERTRFVLEMAKKYKFIGLTRLHVSAWDKTTGV